MFAAKQDLIAPVSSALIGASGVATVIASPTRAGIVIAGTSLAVLFVIAEAFRDTGRPRSWAVTASKIICTVICGIALPGMLREIFRSNTFVQALDSLWETWFLVSFLCGLAGWTLIFTARAFFNRAVDKAAHSKAAAMIVGPDPVLFTEAPSPPAPAPVPPNASPPVVSPTPAAPTWKPASPP